MQNLQVAAAVGMVGLAGVNLTLLGVRLSAPSSAADELAKKVQESGGRTDGSIAVTVPAGKSAGDKIQVNFPGGNRGMVSVPPGVDEGAQFLVRPPRTFTSTSKSHPMFGGSSNGGATGQLGGVEGPSQFAQTMRGVAIGTLLGTGLVYSPIATLEGKALTPARVMWAKVLQPACMVPCAMAMVGVGGASAYTACLEDERLLAEARIKLAAAAPGKVL